MVLFDVTWCYAVLYECVILLLHMLLNVTNIVLIKSCCARALGHLCCVTKRCF